MNQNQLQPCPFCGSKDVKLEEVFYVRDNKTERRWFVGCETCGSRGGEQGSSMKAKKVWNMRCEVLDGKEPGVWVKKEKI